MTTTKKKTIYLANPYGFSEQQRETVLPALVQALEAVGLEVWEPFERNNQDRISSDWAYRIGQKDKQDVFDADAIFAVVNGIPPDEGVMIELGIAIAIGKPTFLFRDDFRRAVDSDEYPLNLMIFSGLPRHRMGALLLHLHQRHPIPRQSTSRLGKRVITITFRRRGIQSRAKRNRVFSEKLGFFALFLNMRQK